MSTKNYGQSGVGKDVQFGKQGNRLASEDDHFEAKDKDGDLTRMKGADAVEQDDFVTLSQVEEGQLDSGFWLNMGDPGDNDGDGDLLDGAIPIQSTDSVSRTIDRLNETLGLLVPEAPSTFPSATLTQSSYITGTAPLLCSGVIPDNTDGGDLPSVVAGGSMSAYRGTSTTVDSNIIGDRGPGNDGVITAFVNNVAGGSLAFTDNTGDSINSGGLQVYDNKDYPTETPGFWQSFDSKINNGAATVGWNRYSIDHSAGGTTNDFFILRDNLTAIPSISGGSISEAVPGSVTQSSGVSHYGSNSQLSLSGVLMSNISGLTYSSNSPLQVDDVSSDEDGLLSGIKSFSFGNVGIATPVAANTTAATALNTVSLTLDQSNAHGIGRLKYRGRNVNGNSSYQTITSPYILHKAGSTSRVDEQNLNTLGSGARVDLGLGDAPGDAPALALPGAPTAWDSTQDLSVAGYLSEAVVAGGMLKKDLTNYQSGYLPVTAQPDYSGKEATQYFDFSFAIAAKSKISISISGSYDSLHVGMPNISDNSGVSPDALNGTWWNAFELYNGAGAPGRAGDTTAGCADGSPASGSTGTTAITFGTTSSTNATNNRIYIRIGLTGSQTISSISVS